MAGRESDEVVEAALVRIRRNQQARHVQRRAAQGDAAAASVVAAAQFRYLDALDGSSDGRAISEVADAIGVDRPRASHLTGELVDEALVERKTMPGDSRYVRVRLTRQGQRLVDEARRARRRSVTKALSGFTEEEARTFAMLLERFVDAWPREQR